MNLAGAPYSVFLLRLPAVAETVGVASSTVVRYFSCCCFWPIVRPHDSNTVAYFISLKKFVQRRSSALWQESITWNAFAVPCLQCSLHFGVNRCEPVQPDMEKKCSDR
mmetsp:Transcript_109033/g.351933  ORF Transcript_109033/g.351933 Transcript_109033/m.351933 type:complete len:108 (+) Transcript_109033:586-909(+)